MAEAREALQMGLEFYGYRVNVAADGEAALAALAAHSYALVLTDLWMPKMTGAELVRRLRACPDLSALPVIMMSASFQGTDPGDIAADAFIHKPFELAPLLSLMARLTARDASHGA